MSRIGGPLRPVPTPTTPGSAAGAATKTPSSTTGANTVRPLGFSTASLFKPLGGGPLGSAGPGRAPSGAVKLSPNDLGVLAQNQGNTNACGTTSLANVMTHWGMPRTHEQIDGSIRAFDMFTAPDKLVEYARDNGLRAELKADASLDDLAHMVDQGVPPIVLMDPDGDNNAGLHYITVTGYNRGADGKISDLVIADSAGGHRYTMPAAEFQERWDNLKMQGVGTGLNNVMITTVPRDGRMITGGDGVSRRASDIQLPKSSFWSSLKSGFARGIANALSNVTMGAQKGWNAIKAVGGAIAKGAKAVGGFIADGAKAVGGAIAKGAQAVGGAIADGVKAVGNFFSGLFG